MEKARTLDELYTGEAVLEAPLYSIGDAARHLRVPQNTLRSWVVGRSYPVKATGRARSTRVIVPAAPAGARLSFLNLVEIHVLDALRRQYRLQLPDIRRAVRYLRERLGDAHPLARRDMLTDGRHLFIEAIDTPGTRTLVNASRDGQLALRDLVELHLTRIDWDRTGFATRLYPFVGHRAPSVNAPRVVGLDPRFSFGRPIIVRLGVPTQMIADRFDAGESIDELSAEYGADAFEIQEALRSEFQHGRAA